MSSINPQSLDWQKGDGLLPVTIQHALDYTVLMMGYMNQESFEKTLKTNHVTLFSRSKNRLWTKGETSGHFLVVESIHTDCDNDAILILAHPQGATCHTGAKSCFGIDHDSYAYLKYIESVITNRRMDETIQKSYIKSLFQRGSKRIAQKVGEEGVEVALAHMARDKDEIINESSDLIFHLLVLLNDADLSFSDVIDCLKARNQIKMDSVYNDSL
jgi:phosphoribosyl-ATP pyrophosphohydrolase/phosphoribosyl-AMP cyclohydrolase